MALPIDEWAAYAEAAGIGTLAANTLVRFALQDGGPDAQTALIPHPGLPSEQAFGDDDIAWEFPRLQVVCRGAKGDHRTPLQKAEDAHRAFGKIGGDTLSGTFYHWAKCTTPGFIGLDDNKRPLYAFNVHFGKDRSA